MTEEEVREVIEQAAREGWTELDLSGKGLRVLPNEIGKLTSLISLDLLNNELSFIPRSIGQLTNLEELNLSVNNLSSLPSET